MMNNYWVIADIHGEYGLLLSLLRNMEKNGFDFAKGDIIVQLGDRNDRGPDTYKVNEWFKTHSLMYPGQVICLMGNHDRMLLDAALGKSDLMYWNGGNATERSYSKETKIYGKNGFGNSVVKAGHWDWLKNLPLYHETDKYFFCHAPIPNKFYEPARDLRDFRQDEHILTWSFVSGFPTSDWVDSKLIPIENDGNFYGEHKICVYGHIHDMYAHYVEGVKKYVVPGVRKYGNSILLDTGAGCSEEGYLSCVRLPDLLVVNSKGETYQLEETK